MRLTKPVLLAVLLGVTTCALSAAALFDPAEKKPKLPRSLQLFAEAKAEDFSSDEACAACHEPHVTSFHRSAHKTYSENSKAAASKQGCQSCHGPGRVHMDHLEEADKILDYVISFKKGDAASQSAACLRCHQDTMSEAHWKKTGHAREDVSCAACHAIHNPNTPERSFSGRLEALASILSPIAVARRESARLLRGDEATICGACHKREALEFRRNSHHPVPEGRMVCSDCHDLHPMKTASRRVKSGRDYCITCHPSTAGPFVFEHDPVAGFTGDGCTECHKPHGAHNPKLLTLYSRGLCNSCHSEQANNHYPGRNCWETLCHGSIHGSNHDRLFLRR